MRNIRLLAGMASVAALLALSACGKSDEEAADSTIAGTPVGEQSAEDVASQMKKVSLKPGQWETTQEITEIKVEGAPEGVPPEMFQAMKGRITKSKSCITPEQAENPSADFLTARKDSKCTFSGFEMAGGSMRGTVSCPGEQGGTANISMNGSYTPDSYDMTMNMNAAGIAGAAAGDMKMQMTIKTNGKFIGECPA